MKRLLLFILLISSNLQAGQIILDQVMSEDEQKKTGVSKLTPKEKIALETWLNKTFTLQVQNQQTATELSLSININNGQKLQLSDNSIWEIAPSDVPTSALWITPFAVKLVPSNDLQYPFLIVNTNTNVSVKARRLPTSNLPQNMTPPAQPTAPAQPQPAAPAQPQPMSTPPAGQ